MTIIRGRGEKRKAGDMMESDAKAERIAAAAVDKDACDDW